VMSREVCHLREKRYRDRKNFGKNVNYSLKDGICEGLEMKSGRELRAGRGRPVGEILNVCVGR